LLSTDAQLVVYYFGFGFVALLAWAAIADDLTKPFDHPRSARWNRASAVLAIAALAHPVLGLIAGDIAIHVARDDNEDRRQPSPFVDRATACAAAGVVAAVVVIVAARS
jgi:hypothetical protein